MNNLNGNELGSVGVSERQANQSMATVNPVTPRRCTGMPSEAAMMCR